MRLLNLINMRKTSKVRKTHMPQRWIIMAGMFILIVETLLNVSDMQLYR